MGARGLRRIFARITPLTAKATFTVSPVACCTWRASFATCARSCSLAGAIRTPTLIALRHRDLAIVSALRARRCRAAFYQQTVDAHHPVHPFGIDRRRAMIFPLPTRQGPHTTVAIAGQISNGSRISSTRPASSVLRAVRPSRQSAGRASLSATFERATPRTSQTRFTGRPLVHCVIEMAPDEFVAMDRRTSI